MVDLSRVYGIVFLQKPRTGLKSYTKSRYSRKSTSKSNTQPRIKGIRIQWHTPLESPPEFCFLLNPWIYYGKIPASTLKYGLENPKNIKNSITAYIKQINDNNLINFIHHSP